MPAETAIYTVLAADGTVAALVVARIYPALAPQGATLPYVVYERISTPRVRGLDGTSGLGAPRFQITSWAESYSGAKALADAVRDALDDYSGTVGTAILDDAFIDDEGDVENLSPGADEQRLFGVRQDFIIWCRD